MLMKRPGVLAAFVVTILSATATARQFHLDQPFQVRIGDKYGFMDANCQMVVPAQYSEAFEFSEGLAAVKVGQKWGYIDRTGGMVVTPQFAGAFQFSGGLASVRLEETSPVWGFIDKAGMVVVKPQFGMPLWFSEGLVEGYGEKNKILNIPLGYVDSKGEYVIRLDEPGKQIEFLLGFSEGLAAVSMRAEYADGSIGSGVWGFLNHSGEWSIKPSYEAAGSFHEGLAAVKKDGLWGYIDKTNKFVITPRFESAEEFSEGLAAVKIAGRVGYIDKTETVVITPKYENASLFRGGMAAFQSNRKLGYIDKKGEVIVPPSLDWGTEFVDGVAAVGLELPAAYGAGVGTGRTGHSPLEEAALAGAKKKPKKRGEPSSSSMKAD